MDLIVQYEQVPSLGTMDTSPASFSAQVMPTFLSNASQDTLQPYTLDQPKREGPARSVMPPLQMPTVLGMPMSNFLDSPMDPIQIPPEPPLLTSGYVPVDPFLSLNKVDLNPDATTLPIATQDPTSLPSASVFGGVAPEALPDSNHAVGRRSRKSTSLSPQSVPSHFSSLSPPRLQPTPTLDYSSAASNSSADEDVQSPPRAVIGQMLKDIAQTALDAGNAFENAQGAQANKVGELRDRIVQILDMLAHMSVANGDAPVPPIPPQLFALEAIRAVEPPLVAALLPPSDQSRKRCASELEDHRGPKALKREQQDDAPLSAILHEESLHSSTFSSPFAAFPVMQSFPASQPPSRAPSPPPMFPTANHFKPAVPLSATTFAPLTTGGTPLPPQSVSSALPTSNNSSAYPPMPHSAWSDPVLTTSRRQHSLSLGSSNGPLILPTTSSSSGLRSAAFPPNGLQTSLSQAITVPSNVLSNTSASTIGPPIGRMSRSGSISGSAFKHAKQTLPEPHPDTGIWFKSKKQATRHNQSSFYFSSEPAHPRTLVGKSLNHTSSEPATAHNSPSDDEDDDDDDDSEEEYGTSEVTSSTQVPGSASAATDMPPEFRADVDKIFFEFLNKLCSNLDATCSKGEQIHQTLMAKKMQRLDESPDFRPFKFRILAFTNAFMDELAEKGFPEEKLPMKKVRNYLWRQQYILRFNEDGKKAKSKGNHIWSIEAKKSGDGKWEFRPFHRKLAGPPPGVAYVGLRWTWKPRIWDPQISFKKIQVTYNSPSLPSWLSWKNGELCGVPPPDTESCQVTAIAKFVVDGVETELPLTFTIAIAPVSALDGTSYARQRRPSFPCGEPAPKRSTSDSALSSAPQRTLNPRTRVDDRAVIQVLQNVAQRVTDEAESQFVATSTPKQGEIHALAKQKHVLEQTVNAYDRALSGHGHLQARRLAVAAQHVVLQAAQTIVADKTNAVGGVTTSETESVSLHELTDKTQDAIAMAVKMNGPTSNEVDIIVTATSILKQATPPPPAMNSRHPMVGPSTPRLASAFPPPTNLSTLPEHV